MSKLSNRLSGMKESQTIRMSKLSRELSSKGVDVINLSLGEPDFNTPEFIRESAKVAIDNGYTFYTPISGYLDLREAISDKFKTENNLSYGPDEIVVSNGAKQSLANTVLCLVNPGDEVIVPKPYWVSYIEMIKLAEGVPVFIDTDIRNDFKMTPAQLQAVITPKTKLLMFSSPCNPTGSVYSHGELKALSEVIVQKDDFYVVSDEIYEHINFTGQHESIAQFDFIKDRIITVNGVSKGYAMTGWRIGYLGAPKWIAQACDKIQGQITSAPSSIAQRAALAAVKGGLDTVTAMQKVFLQRRNLVLELLKEIPGITVNVPQGAFYVFPEVSSYLGKSDGTSVMSTTEDLTIYLLNKGHVSMVAGEAFGAPGYIRFSYATSEDKIREAVKRIKTALSLLR